MSTIHRIGILILFTVAGLPLAAQVGPIGGPPLFVKNVTVIDGAGKTTPNVSVEVRGGKIEAIGPQLQPQKDETVIDAAGKFLIPGLIDTRVQLSASPANKIRRAEVGQEQRIAWSHSMVKLGVTTARLIQGDLDEQKDLRTWRDRALLNAPNLVISGPVFTAPGGIPSNQYGPIAWATRQREVFEVDTADQARDKSRVVAHDGGDIFEIVYSAGPRDTVVPRLANDALATIVKEAHGHELKTFCWVGTDAEAATAVASGCDNLEGVTEELIGDATLKAMKDKNVGFVPMLVAQGYLIDHVLPPAATKQYLDDPFVASSLSPLMKQSLESATGQLARVRDVLGIPAGATAEELQAAEYGNKKTPQSDANQHATTIGQAFAAQEQRSVENLKRAKAAGVRIVSGTGAGGVLDFPGPSEHLELELMVRDGLTPAEAIEAATRNAAISIGRDKELGTIEVGKRADFVILDANPLTDIRNTTKIHTVVRTGWVIDRDDPQVY